ncbi:MAG TPA: M15 family metallopeptidase [Candidatus Limnocylindrales bacterium]|nr:M15 family metallopeptidase [Candidatus Limnocylindrales bacterium]
MQIPARPEGWHVVLDNPDNPCPPEILARQVGVVVLHRGFDGRMHKGLIEVHVAVSQDVHDFFAYALEHNFPIQEVVSASHPDYAWDDGKLMTANATSGFNYRLIAGSNTVSKHGQGLAFDVSPRLNPYIRYGTDGSMTIAPSGARWDPARPGTLSKDHPLVVFMKNRGWDWGGEWPPESGRVDYQHFEKPER